MIELFSSEELTWVVMVFFAGFLCGAWDMVHTCKRKVDEFSKDLEEFCRKD